MCTAFKNFQNASTNISFDPQRKFENEGAEKVLLSAFPSKETEIKIVASCYSGPIAGMSEWRVGDQLL